MNIIILNKNLEQEAVISSWIEASFSQSINSQGAFRLRINANSKQAEEIELGQIVYLEPEMCGYINRIERISEKNVSDEVLSISGIALKDTMKSRITYPPSGQESYSYTETKADSIACDLIDKLLINPTDSRKKVSIFKLDGISAIGSEMDFSTRLKPLDSQVYELLSYDNLGLKCWIDLDAKTACFKVFEGVDRTINQMENPRAVFSLDMGTLQSSIVFQNSSSYRSDGYFGGAGTGTSRTIIELPDSNTFTGLDRWETFIDIRDASTSDELEARGNILLTEFDRVYSVKGGVDTSDKMEYDIGDFVTIRDRTGNYENVQITGRTRSFSGSNTEKTGLVFGKAPLTISQAITNRLVGLNNILTK